MLGSAVVGRAATGKHKPPGIADLLAALRSQPSLTLFGVRHKYTIKKKKLYTLRPIPKKEGGRETKLKEREKKKGRAR